MNRRLAIASLAAALLGLGACATSSLRARPIKDLKPAVQSEMSTMAAAIRDVEGVLQSDASLTPGDAERIVELLVTLEKSAKALDPASPAFAHPSMAEKLPLLREHAAAALVEAKATPPKYDAFGKFAAVCNSCHAAPN